MMGATPVELARGFVDAADGTPLRYAVHGAAGGASEPLVVLSHGAGGNGAVWFQQVPALVAQYRVLTWDSRGFGRTPVGSEPLSPELAAADLWSLVDHLGGTGPVHLVGQSMGGWTVTAAALAAPDRVRSVTWCDTIGGLWTDELRAAFAELVSRPDPLGRPDHLARHPALWDGTGDRDPALGLLYRELGAMADPPMAQVGMALAGYEADPDRVRALGLPMLVVAGEHDGLFPPRALAHLAATLGASWAEIPAAGHSPYFEQPEAFNRALLAFLVAA
jgi:pimeloyl-ACP methyl ester carboxylesterase